MDFTTELFSLSVNVTRNTIHGADPSEWWVSAESCREKTTVSHRQTLTKTRSFNTQTYFMKFEKYLIDKNYLLSEGKRLKLQLVMAGHNCSEGKDEMGKLSTLSTQDCY